MIFSKKYIQILKSNAFFLSFYPSFFGWLILTFIK